MGFAVLHNCMHGGLLHREYYRITYGGSKLGIRACLYNQQQHNMLKLEKECWIYNVLLLDLAIT